MLISRKATSQETFHIHLQIQCWKGLKRTHMGMELSRSNQCGMEKRQEPQKLRAPRQTLMWKLRYNAPSWSFNNTIQILYHCSPDSSKSPGQEIKVKKVVHRLFLKYRCLSINEPLGVEPTLQIASGVITACRSRPEKICVGYVLGCN